MQSDYVCDFLIISDLPLKFQAPTALVHNMSSFYPVTSIIARISPQIVVTLYDPQILLSGVVISKNAISCLRAWYDVFSQFYCVQSFFYYHQVNKDSEAPTSSSLTFIWMGNGHLW